MPARRGLTAIDLYAGVGGWAVGLHMAGIDVVRSYEWWEPAAKTHADNLRGDVVVADIRKLDLAEFPKGVDIVVGSPPCTQFSYSNRGGSGDIADGLRDVEKFLAVVDYVQPTYWAMENVPRVASILRAQIQPGGALERYAYLFDFIEVVDASEWGVPQRRKRMLAGRFDFERLKSFREVLPARPLGDVVKGLKKGDVDPVFGWPVDLVTDNLEEVPLTPEELRMNRDQKTFHRVYNKMAFPEPMGRPSRTVTALCTRVSRESLIIKDGRGYRRLTVRERASLQSFPVAYQFSGKSHAARVKMVGNAIPPLLTYAIGMALQGSSASRFSVPAKPPALRGAPSSAAPDEPKRRHKPNRTFAAAIPGLRFGSGTRFDLTNRFSTTHEVSWVAGFYFGTSKKVVNVPMDSGVLERMAAASSADFGSWVDKIAEEVADLATVWHDPADLQERWVAGDFESGPFQLVDAIGGIAERALTWLPGVSGVDAEGTLMAVLALPDSSSSEAATRKIRKTPQVILAGAATCSLFNTISPLARHNGEK